jgi:hypothetical protein
VVQTEGTRERWCARWSLASGYSRARKLTDGGTIERGEDGEPNLGLTGARAAAWRPADGEEMAAERSSGFERGEE